MASINYAARQISVKIVYYGPGLSGKTTNLQVIHKKTPQDHRSDMVSLATETDRTLFFDFLPLDLGKIKGFATKFQLYTVPGQVYYNATRKLVLRGVDGVVFVADSGADKIQENLESFQNLEDNLAEYGYQRESIPIIIQYNKRDLPNALPIEDLQRHVNKYNLPYSEGVAYKGVGVFDTLKMIGKVVIDYLNKKYSRGAAGGKSAAPEPQAPVGGYTPSPTASMPAYQPPAAPAYQQPAAPAYQPPAAPAYQPPAAPAYQPPTDYQTYAPPPAAPIYQQPAAPAYQPPATPVYQQPVEYQSYAAPVAPQVPVYQPPQQSFDSFESFEPAASAPQYQAPPPPVAPAYQPPMDYQPYAAPVAPQVPAYQPQQQQSFDSFDSFESFEPVAPAPQYQAPTPPAAPTYQQPMDYQPYAAPAAPQVPAYQPPQQQSFDSFDSFESFEPAAPPAPQYQAPTAPAAFEMAAAPQVFEPMAPPPPVYEQHAAFAPPSFEPPAAQSFDPFLQQAAPAASLWAAEMPAASVANDNPFSQPSVSAAPVFERQPPPAAPPPPAVNYDDVFLAEPTAAVAAPPAYGTPQAGGGYEQPSPFDFDVAPQSQPPAAQTPPSSMSNSAFDFQQFQPADQNYDAASLQFNAPPQEAAHSAGGYPPTDAASLQFNAPPQEAAHSAGGYPPADAAPQGGQSELDLEIEKYQREIEEKQKKMRTAGGNGTAFVGFPPPSANPRPDAQEMLPYTGPGDNSSHAPITNANDNSGGYSGNSSFCDFEAELSGAIKTQQFQQSGGLDEDYHADSAMFFTSVDRNTAILKKVNKPPVNPAKKTAQQQPPKGLVSKLFGKN